MKIYIHYEITDEPWGGINSFFKAFRNYIRAKRLDIKLAESIRDTYDILFMSANYCGQGKKIDYEEIKKISERSRERGFGSFFRKSHKCKIIHRVDGLRSIYAQDGIFSESDREQYALLKLADWGVFQSRYSLEAFQSIGYSDQRHSIIYNGVDQKIFNTLQKKGWDGQTKIKVLATSWSSNKNKGFETISMMSEVEGLEVTFVGNWCEEVDPLNVKVIPPLRQEEMAKYYKQSHIFLHPSLNDFCPNVVLEALSSGLPIIYHNSGGTKELAANYGVPLPEIISKESLTKAVAEIKANYSLYMGRIENDMKKFSIDTVAEQYINIFEKVLRNED